MYKIFVFALALLLFALLFSIPGESLRAAETRGQVAVVAPERFLKTLEPWIRYRSEQGYEIHVLVEPTEEHETAPERIRRRLRLLDEQVSLDAVLLVGRARPRSGLPQRPTIPSPLLPCRLIQHFAKETELASDDWYADLDGDGLPDVSLGRFPAATPEELESIIRKTIRYETEIKPGPWRRRIQVVAGVGNFSPLIDHAIESAARSVLTKTVPASWEIALLHANWKSPFCPEALSFESEVVESINRGSLFWAYLGHGHPRMLQPLETPEGRVRSLDADRFPALRCRDSLPIALLFCCYGGLLDRDRNSVAEEMFLQNEGPVAVVAASRTTMPFGMSLFGIELLREFLVEDETVAVPGPLTLGDWVLAGKRRMLVEPAEEGETKSFRAEIAAVARLLDPMPEQLDVQIAEHAALFHLFGDPLLRLPRPEKLRVESPAKVKPGQNLAVTVSLDRAADEEGTLRLELVLPSKRLSLASPQRDRFTLDEAARQAWNEEYVRSNQTVVQSVELRGVWPDFRIELPVPAELRGEYDLRAFWSSDRRFALGSGRVSVTFRR